MDLDKKIGEKLKQLRDARGYSTREVGRRIDISNSYVSQIEKGKSPSLSTLQKLCNLYGVRMASLFGEEVESNEELKDLGVDWMSFAEEMEKQNLTPEEVKKYVEVVKTLKGLS